MNYIAFIILLPLIGLLVFIIFRLKTKINAEKNAKEKANNLARYFANEKNKMEEILQGIQDGIITVNLDGLIISANRKALELLNASEATIISKHINSIIPTLQSTREPTQNFEFSKLTLQGKRLWIKLKTLPLIGWDNKNKGYIYILEDATKEKEFTDMQVDFVAMAAHELRTPLTVIRSYLLVLINMIKDKLNAEEQLFLERIRISSEQLSSLIENLLSVSRIEGGGIKLKRNYIYLEKLISETINQIGVTAKQKDIIISFIKPPKSTSAILADPNLISSALTNLIDNAIQFSNPKSTVTITLQKQQDKIIVHVSDHGKGISTSDTPYIFTKFYKASHKLIQESKGSGLGLYIAKSIIEAHQGKIWFNSIEHKGSTFSFYLPANNLEDQQKMSIQKGSISQL